MKIPFVTLATAASVVQAAYPGDIVYYWVDQSATFVNGTVIGGLQSPPSAWAQAVVQGAVYQAAVKSKHESLEFQQLAVSHAAHNALLWVFHGTRLYNPVDAALRAIVPRIGLDPGSPKGKDAVRTGQSAAAKVAGARADDKITNFVDFAFGPKEPGVYQQSPGSNPFPDTPQARYITAFAALGDLTRFRAPPPPSPDSVEYEAQILYVKEYGELNSTSRSAYDTDTAYFWRESSITGWNRLAGAVVGSKLATDVTASAKFYAQLNYALANAGFASWDTKYTYLTWRPDTALHHPHPFVHSNTSLTTPSWTPLLRPTPSHPDYVSTHSTFGGAAAAVIRAWNRDFASSSQGNKGKGKGNGGEDSDGDVIDATLSSTVTLDNRGVITRRYTSLRAAAEENSKSRVFGGIHFPFAGVEGIALGERVALATLGKFDANWDKF